MTQPKMLLFLIVALLSCTKKHDPRQTDTTSSTFDEAAETAAIMAVIKNETKCFFDGDYTCWASNWSHADYAMQTWNNSDGTADAAIGWAAIEAQGKGWIETNYKNEKNVIHPDFKTTKPKVKFFGDKAAYLMWTQYNADKDKKHYRISEETRIMEKVATGWKNVNVTAMWDTTPKISVDNLPMGLQ